MKTKLSICFCIVASLLLVGILLAATQPVGKANGQALNNGSVEPVKEPAETISPTIQLPRTGQRTCYGYYGQDGQIVDCAGTGQDGDIQAGAAWPDPRFEFTYCDSSGPCADQSEDCDQNPATDIALDRLTGLVWTRSGSTLPYSVTWDVALDFANDLTLCGYDDWRMPNVLELQSMINAEFSPYTYPYPDYNWLHEAGFVDVYTEFYWSSTTAVAQPGNFFESRGMFGGTIQEEPGAGGGWDWQDTIWPVRAGQNGVPDPTYPVNLWKTGQTESVLPGDDGDLQMGVAWPDLRFTIVLTDCVQDNLTGLIWPREVWAIDEYGYPDDALTWVESIDRANSFSLCGYEDWRLPNEWEMLSLVDFSQSAPALPAGHPFTNAIFDEFFATSTTYPWWTDNLFHFDLGATGRHFIDSLSKDAPWYYSLPVRGGILGTPLRPDLTINYPYGHVGSYLTITGNFWAPNDTLYMTINGVAVGEPITVTGKGDFSLSLETDQADPGTYTVQVSDLPPEGIALAFQTTAVEDAIGFVLDNAYPLREWDGTEPVFSLPAGLGTRTGFLPVVVKTTP